MMRWSLDRKRTQASGACVLKLKEESVQGVQRDPPDPPDADGRELSGAEHPV